LPQGLETIGEPTMSAKTDSPPPKPTPTTTNRSRRRGLYWLAGLAVVLAAIIVQLVMSGLSAFRNTPRPPASPQSQR
jgi:hypothetical protein